MGTSKGDIISRLKIFRDPESSDYDIILPETVTTAVKDPDTGESLDILLAELAAENEMLRAALATKANRTQPETYELPLLDGISKHHQAFFYKTENDIVTVSFSISIEEGEFEVYNEIAILPEGFRPAELIENACTMSSAGTYSPGTVQVLPDGVIKILLLQQGGFVAHSSCIAFPASLSS